MGRTFSLDNDRLSDGDCRREDVVDVGMRTFDASTSSAHEWPPSTGASDRIQERFGRGKWSIQGGYRRYKRGYFLGTKGRTAQ